MIIQVDTASLVEQFHITPQQENELLDFTAKEITARFADEWQNSANNVLKSSRQQYINSIVVSDDGPAKGSVTLVGVFPNMLEAGVEEFDIKEGILNGPNAKTSESGVRYNTVPFGQGTPGSLAENFNGGIMPKEIHDIVKKKSVDKITGMSAPLKQSEIPKPFDAKKVKQVVMPKSKSFAEYEHKSSIYAGIRKEQDQKTGQNTYGSFRRISDNSDEASWIHPGLEARGLADKTLTEFDIPSQVGQAFDKWWANK